MNRKKYASASAYLREAIAEMREAIATRTEQSAYAAENLTEQIIPFDVNPFDAPSKPVIADALPRETRKALSIFFF